MWSWNISLLSTLSISRRGTCRGRQKRVRWSASWPAHTADSTSAKRLPPSGLVQTESRLDTHSSAITSLQRRWKPLQRFLISLWYQTAVYCLFLLSKLSGYPVNWCVDEDFNSHPHVVIFGQTFIVHLVTNEKILFYALSPNIVLVYLLTLLFCRVLPTNITVVPSTL